LRAHFEYGDSSPLWLLGLTWNDLKLQQVAAFQSELGTSQVTSQ